MTETCPTCNGEYVSLASHFFNSPEHAPENWEECHSCGRRFDTIAIHWSMSECSHPKLSDKQKSILRGLILGDGSVSKSGEMIVTNTNEKYLNYLDDRLDDISRGVKFRNSGKEQAEMSYNSGFDNGALDREYSDVYYLSTSVHPYLKKMREKWYSSGNKEVVSDITLDKYSMKNWYVCDGTLRHRENASRRESIEISSTGDLEKVKRMLEDCGFDPTKSEKYNRVEFGVDDTADLFDWVGDPVEGFKYKWPKDRV